MDRRHFLRLAAASGAAALGARAASGGATAVDPREIRAIAFDAFPLLDPRPVQALADAAFPGQGAALVGAWRIRQFEYQWLRALGGQYADFARCTADALTFATRQLDLPLTAAVRDRLLGAWSALPAWPDVPAALDALRGAGFRLAVLSNLSPDWLAGSLRTAGIAEAFEHVLSTDARRTFKPAPDAYRLAPDALGLAPSRIAFAAFAGWDAAGAHWFGFPTVWINRLGAPPEELDTAVVATGGTLATLTEWLLAR